MENCVGRYTGLSGLWRRFIIAGTGFIVLCCASCQSMKRTETSERLIQTEQLRQEVILLPESERLIVDLSALGNLAPASALIAPKENAGGLTVKKRADGLIEIESRRDTVRIRGDTVCSHEYMDLDTVGTAGGRPWRPWVIVLVVFFILGILFCRRIR